ncbi:hypothetical protein F53441_8715 [Fusarium austroafricanum]|uniref:BTB domain-containing protein n=1 Tax=Fusarium austroafricanum TaxID=2364996 RepID=A0A8H4KAR3_9HYPO|nr:hypothetical protein F53441_8715 [Fusarium austroafricanum]
MSDTRFQIDPDGDTLVIFTTLQFSSKTNLSGEVTEQHFLCSKKHLTFASHRAAKFFSNDFREVTKEADGLYHWKLKGIFKLEALKLVIKIIHGKTSEVPQDVELDLLADIASIVDNLVCHDALSFYSQNWLLKNRKKYSSLLRCGDMVLAQLILVAYVFEDAALFENSTSIAIRYRNGILSTFLIPIRVDILEQIEDSRVTTVEHLADGLDEIEDGLLEQKLGCSYGLGYFTIDSIIKSLRKIQSPRHFSPMSDCSAGKHSGTWRLFDQPSSPPASRSTPSAWSSSFADQTNSAPRATSGGMFGAKTMPLRENGSLGGTSSSPFGKPFGSRGGFGSGSNFGVPIKDENEAPQVLVRHHCHLKDFVDPLLDKMEERIKGLKLAAFPLTMDDDTVLDEEND